MITDGLPETTNMNMEMIGIDGVAAWFAESAKAGEIDDCIKNMLKIQQDFTKGRILKDDNTLVGIECKE